MSEIMSNQLYVTGYSCIKIQTSMDVKKIFQEFKDSVLQVSYQGNYSIVTFNSYYEAKKAQQQINGMNYDNNILIAEITNKYDEQGIKKIYICSYCGKQGHTNDICPHIPLKNRAKPNSSRSSSSKSESYSFEISVNPRRRRNRNQKIHKNRKQRSRSGSISQNDDNRMSREDSPSYRYRHKSPIKIHLTINLKQKHK